MTTEDVSRESRDQSSNVPAATRGSQRETVPGRANAATARQAQHAALTTDHGNTRISDAVVAKIAGLATKEIPGVYDMGKGMARTFGKLRAQVPGSGQTDSATQGVTVEVGERQAAADLDIVTFYGQSIVEVSEAVRRNVIERIEAMTGLQVTEVNITVDDLYVEGGDGETEQQESRVQ